MKKTTLNTFGAGMVQDLEPLTTPNNVLTHCLNGTTITYNGNEFVLQNDMGNCKVERAKLSPGFLPMGVKEYGGIIYIASYNPDTQECEVGSFPSPERDITGTDSIENQTGLQDGFFATDDYRTSILRTVVGNDFGEFTPQEITSKIQKLNEQEVLRLSPGDMYITTYEVNVPTSPEPGAVVIDSDNYDDYFSTDPTQKKTFSVNFYKIDLGNNITEIPNNEIKSIEYRNDIEADEYIYYTQTSAGSIAVEYKLNELSYFDSAVREISRRSEPNKKIRIEAIGESDSDIKFSGVRVDLLKNEGEPSEDSVTFHLENDGLGDKVSCRVEDFVENDIVKCEITPYGQYGYFPKLMQTFSLELGRNLSSDTVNSIFKWKVNESSSGITRLELDYDFRLETDEPLMMYIEFYDTWSNVSVLKTIPAPSIYGPMRLVMTLIDEERTNVFDTWAPNATSGEKGGVQFNKLRHVLDTEIQKPYLVDKTKNEGGWLIYTDNSSLRKDHFYIVRICGYHRDPNDLENYIFYDAYRGLYTSSIYNDIYDSQVGISPTNPAYTPNFNDIPYPLDKIKYNLISSPTGNLTITKEPIVTDFIPKTFQGGKNQYFSVNETVAPSRIVGGELILENKYTASRSYSVAITRPNNYIYDKLKPNTLVIESPGDVSITGIIDNDLSASTGKTMGSTGKISVDPVIDTESNGFNVSLNVTTNRPIWGKYEEEVEPGTLEKATLFEYLYQPTYNNLFTQGCANHLNARQYATHVFARRRHNLSEDPKVCEQLRDTGIRLLLSDRALGQVPVDGSNTMAEARKGKQNNDERHTSEASWAFNNVAHANKNFYKSWLLTHSDYVENFVNATTGLFLMAIDKTKSDDNIMFFLLNRPGSWDNAKFEAMLKKLTFWRYNPLVGATGYYIDRNTTIAYSSNSLTEIPMTPVYITSKWDAVAKKYIFTAIIKGISDLAIDFDTAQLNTLIDAAKVRSSHELVAGATNLDDNGFIPFIDENTNIVSVSTLNIEREEIRVGSDVEIKTLFEQSYNQHQAFKEANDFDENAIRDITAEITDPRVESSLIDFANCFQYDPNTQQIVFKDSALTWSTNRAKIKSNRNSGNALFESQAKIQLPKISRVGPLDVAQN